MHLANPNLQRAELLLNQRRYDLAEEHARRAIGEDPNLATAYSYLALCLSHADKHTEATEAARRAVGLAPDDAYAHYVLGIVLHERDDSRGALLAAEESLRLDPGSPNAWSLLGSINLGLRRWQAALEAADSGLKFDAEHESCVNIRAAALTGLGRTAESGQAIDATLARNPENAHSHANMGWTLLHRREPRKALEHFREALRLDPSLEHARAGIVEAMKARNFIYRWFLAYFLFMSRLSDRARWGILIGGYVAYRIAGAAVRSGHALAPLADIFVVAYLVFALGTVVSYPLFNLLLSLSRFGRYALSREQFIAAIILGITILIPLSALGVYLATRSGGTASIALIAAPLIIPVGITGLMRAGRDRWIMIAVTAVLVLVATGLIAAEYAPRAVQNVAGQFILFYVLGCLLTTWLGNILATLRPKVKR